MNRFARFWIATLSVLFLLTACRKDASNSPPPSAVAASFTPPSIVQITQANWFVNPAAGGCGGGGCSDLNDCATSATACKTHAEIFRRWQCGKLMQATSVFVLSTLPATDPIDVCVNLYGGGLSYFAGPTSTVGSGATSLQSGTLSSCVATAPLSNVQSHCVDTAITNWNAALNHRIRILTGTNAGRWAFVQKDLGGGLGAASGEFSNVGSAVNSNSNMTNGDTYQIDGLIGAQLGNISPICGNNQVSTANFLLQDFALTWSASTSVSLTIQGTCPVRISAGTITPPPFSALKTAISNFQLANIGFLGAINGSGFQQFGGQVQSFAGLFTGSSGLTPYTVLDGGVYAPRQGTVFEGGGPIAQSGAIVLSDAAGPGGNIGLGIFDAVAVSVSNPNGSALVVGGGGNSFRGTPSLSVMNTTSIIYGSGNAGVGIEVQAGSTASINGNSAVPSVTGTLGDFRLASGSSQAYAFNNSTNAYTAASISQTWANFAATIAGGGFGGNAHNLQDNAHFVTYHFLPPLALLALRRRRKKPANDNARARDFWSRAA